MQRWAVMCVVAALALYVGACLAPALEFQHNGGRTELKSGYELLLLGWLAVFAGQFAWFANPLLAGSLVCLGLKRSTSAAILAVLALVFAAQTLVLFGQTLPADEANVSQLALKRLAAGFAMWIGSIFLLLIAALLQRRAPRPAPPTLRP